MSFCDPTLVMGDLECDLEESLELRPTPSDPHTSPVHIDVRFLGISLVVKITDIVPMGVSQSRPLPFVGPVTSSARAGIGDI